VSADSRKPWKDIFFDSNPDTPLAEDKAGNLKTPLEGLSLAPSASNKQPWRLVKTGEKLHIFLERTPGYSKPPREDIQLMDIGIAMCNFDIAAEEAGVKGAWKPGNDQKGKTGWESIATWQHFSKP
jgi:nitroreductase